MNRAETNTQFLTIKMMLMLDLYKFFSYPSLVIMNGCWNLYDAFSVSVEIVMIFFFYHVHVISHFCVTEMNPTWGSWAPKQTQLALELEAVKKFLVLVSVLALLGIKANVINGETALQAPT